MAEKGRTTAAQAVEYLAGLGKPADRAKVLVVGTGCSGCCDPKSPCTIRSLRGSGVLVDFYDQRLSEANCGGLRARGIGRLTPAALHRYDMVILQQPCSPHDYGWMAGAARCLLDARPDQKDCII